MITVAETQEYHNKVEKLLDKEEQKNIIDYISAHPKSGDLIQNTGGIRKLRWKRNNKGKSGGVRIIYYYYNSNIPIYLLTLFAKGDTVNLSKSQRNDLAKLVKLFKDL